MWGGGYAVATDDELQELDRKLKQLRLDYDRYFLGNRPREPMLLRGEVDKRVVILANGAIQNTALRFKFNSICSRYQALKRQWNETLRKMENGTYARHRFKADLHERERLEAAQKELDAETGAADRAGAKGGADLFAQYREARLACGQDVKNLSPGKLERLIDKQRVELRQRFGDQAEFDFRVVVEDGRAKLKASRSRA
jgi:hypothetical protein